MPHHPPAPNLPAIPVLAGPTASGKTALSLELAEVFPLELISADAMMVYKGLDVGTAKPTPAERARVPHHGLDLVEAWEMFSVRHWVELAEQAITDVLKQGKIPLVVGGTGFYIRALSQGLPTTPESDPSTVGALELELLERGLDAMLLELETVSPHDAVRTERNPRRVVRALEVLRTTGRPASDFALRPAKFNFSKFVLLPERSGLLHRIEARTKKMLRDGLIEEAKLLLPYFVQPGRTASAMGQNGVSGFQRITSFQAIGYKQVLDHLTGVFMPDGTRRELPIEEVETRINLATRQYAKRQETWFRAEPNAQIFPDLRQVKAALEQHLLAWPQT